MQDIVLDNIKFPTGKEKDGARFRQIQEERLNRNFRRLLENDANKNSATALPDSIRVGDNIDIYKPTVHHEAVLEQFGSTVTSHSASGNYAKVVTFSTDVTVGKNLLNPIIYQGGSYNAAIGTQWTLTQSATQLTKSGSTFTISLGSWSSRLFVVQVNEGTTYHVKAVFSGDNIATTRGFLSSSYEVMTVSNLTGASADIDLTITPTTGQAYYYILFAPRGSTQTITIESPQLEVGSYATPYEPYRDASDLNINAPLTLEYIRSADTSPTRLTINFNRNYSLASFTSDNSVDAYLHNSSTAHWDLYIGKASASDSVEILDMHNPWSNTDMTIEWEDSSVSTLPTGAMQAIIVPIVVEVGTSNGWEYRLYSDKKIIATRTIEQSIASYTTWNGMYGYNLANISTPFTMTNTIYYVSASWKIGSGFSIPAGVTATTTTTFNLLALSSASGAQDCIIRLYLEGYKQ